MRRKIQPSLFDQKPKRGRPSLKPHGHFGGAYLKNYNPKYKRPLDSKKALHLVLKSSKAVGAKSFKHKKHEDRVWEIISTYAAKAGIQIYEYANAGNHLHLLIRVKHSEDYKYFIRSITGIIARTVGNAEKRRPLVGNAEKKCPPVDNSKRGSPHARTKEKFWDARPFSRVVSFAKQEFRAVKKYLLRNTLEAIGWMPYVTRGLPLPLELRILLGLASGSSTG